MGAAAGVGTDDPLPIVVAGDVFDRWDSPAELINFALAALPRTTILAVSGQHDQPHHRIDDLNKSAYWTLAVAGRIRDLWQGWPGVPCVGGGFVAWGFPWGAEPAPVKCDGCIHLAVIHRYLWVEGHNYPDAPQEGKIDNLLPRVGGYNAVLSGDNHRAFMVRRGEQTFLNPGAFIRRRTDERDLAPAYGILWSDGTVTTKPLDTSGDTFADAGTAAQLERAGVDSAGLVKLLNAAADGPVSFRETARRYLDANDVEPGTAALVREWLEAS